MRHENVRAIATDTAWTQVQVNNKPKKFFVHYTVRNPAPAKLVAGPYDEDKVIEHRRDIASYAYVENCFVSEDATP
jgi:hypothetical protein